MGDVDPPPVAEGMNARTTGVGVFGTLVARYRTAAGLTQARLANEAGLSVGAVQAWENGRRRHARLDTLNLLSKALGLSADDRAALFAAAFGSIGAGESKLDSVSPPMLHRAEQHTGALGDYLQALRHACQRMPYVALRTRPVPPLSDIYVEQLVVEQLRIEQLREEGARDKEGRSSNSLSSHKPAAEQPVLRAEDLLHALQRYPNVILEAGPGLGKSTLLHHLVLSLIDGRANGADLPVPVLVTAHGLSARTDSLSESLRRQVTHELKQLLGPALPVGFFASPPTPGATWLVLVDGLDEVVSQRARHELIDSILHHMAGQHQPYRFVVTSRPLPELSRFGQTSIGRYSMRPFGPGQVETFARSWFAAGASSDDEATKFLRLVKDSRIAELARLPLLLTMAALVHEQHRSTPFPENRAKLYRSFVDILLESEEAERAVWDNYVEEWRKRYQEKGERAANALVENRRSILEHLAIQQLLGQPGDLLEGLSSFARERKWFGREFDENWLDQQLLTLLRRTGIVVQRGDEPVFIHQTVGEYLAASALAARSSPQDEALRAAMPWRNGHWREVVLFLLAIWSERKQDVSELLRDIWPGSASSSVHDRSALMFVAAALADGAYVDDRLANDVTESLGVAARNSWISGYTAYTAYTAKDWLFALGRLRGRAHAAETLKSLIASPDLGTFNRVQAAEALAALGFAQEAISELQGIASSLQTDVGSCIQLAEALANLGQRDDAVSILGQLSAKPTLGGSDRVRAIVALGKLGSMDIAIGMLRRMAADVEMRDEDQERPDQPVIISPDPDPYAVTRALTARFELAEAFADLGHRNEALSTLDQLSANPALDDSLRVQIAAARGKLGHDEEAFSQLRKLVTSPEVSLSDRLRAAEILGELGLKGEASSILMRVAADPLLEISWRVAAAKSLGQLGFNEAIGMLQALAAEAVGNTRISAATALATLGHHDEAASLLRQISDESGIGGYIYVKAAEALAELGFDTDAIRILRRLATDSSLDSGDRVQAAIALAELGFDREAIPILQWLTTDSTLHAEDRIEAAQAHRIVGWKDEAVRLLKQLAQDLLLTHDVRTKAAEALLWDFEIDEELPDGELMSHRMLRELHAVQGCFEQIQARAAELGVEIAEVLNDPNWTPTWTLPALSDLDFSGLE